jgi:hypothetical protein
MMILLLPLIYALIWCARAHWLQAEEGKTEWPKLFKKWAFQGLGIPLLLWAVVNTGWLPRIPSLVPSMANAQAHGQEWFWLWIFFTVSGAVFITIYWAALTYTWLFARIIAQCQDKKGLAATAGLVSLLSGPLAFVVAFWGEVWAWGLALLTWLIPVVHTTIDLGRKLENRPLYSRAIARLKFGKYTEAEREVISQLEKCENDFEGWMMLAELYATQFRNIRDAAQVILDICKDPKTEPIQISLACHKLADWQLELESNPTGARAALELLCRKLPETHFARMAELRIKQIPKTEEDLHEIKNPKPIPLPSLREDFDSAGKERVSKSEAKAQSERLIERLTADPNDIVAREKLASVFAEGIGQPDLGIEQLQLLIDLAEPSDEQKAKWLAQIAAWELNLKANQEKFGAVLKQIIRDYPQTAQAFAAQRRLYLLEMGMLEPKEESAAEPKPPPRLHIRL